VVEPFPLIAITLPGASSLGEAAAVVEALDSGAFSRVHIRKDAHADAVGLLRALPTRIHDKISLHNALAADVSEFPHIGVHLTGRTPSAPAGFTGVLSRSCHSLAETDAFASEGDYAFLSPVYDSLSKPGYRAAFSMAELARAGAEGRLGRVFALGGVTPARLRELQMLGFAGAAMLGAAWK
jgi:thiamine-phosphate pyrophosphorylase